MSFAKAFVTVVALALVVASFGCRSARQSNQHQLLVYTPRGPDMLRDFVARYKQAHPDTDGQFLKRS